MLRFTGCFVVMLSALLMVAGCSSGPVEKKITVENKDASLNEAKQILTNYSKGQPAGSEMATFPELVERVRKHHPEKADILKNGLEDLQKPGADLASTADEILKKL